MATELTNNTGLPLSMAVWLAADEYDHDADENVISVTALLKPLRQIILGRQNKDLIKTGDITSQIASSYGTAIHNAVENSWIMTKYREAALLNLGYPQRVVDKIVVNPTPQTLKKYEKEGRDVLPVYLEQRGKRKVGIFIVSGKFDFVGNGRLEDVKTTGTYGYVNSSNSLNYILQGSIYRWLFPEIIKDDTILINFVFTDWSALSARSQHDYPQTKLLSKSYSLMSLEETDEWINGRINSIMTLKDKPQSEIPLCTEEELWKGDDEYKYYNAKAKVEKKRATRNFKGDSTAAQERFDKDGGTGEIVIVSGKIKRCKYCDVVNVCEQAAVYLKEGIL